MRVLNFGSLNIDYVYRVDHILVKGETESSFSRNIFAGGKGLNQSVALGRAGVNVFHAGCIGEDGRFMVELLNEAGVDTRFIKVLTDSPSGHTVIQNDKEGDNCILLYGGANIRVTKEQVDETLSEFIAGDYLVLQNEISELPYIIEKASEKGMVIVLNPAPMNENIQRLELSHVDYFILNEIEAAQLTAGSSDKPSSEPGEAELVNALGKEFPSARIVLTLGAAGSVYFDGKEIIRQGIYEVKAVDTTAAGDTFAGYFLAGITEGKPVKEALDMAAKASSITVTRPGAAPSIPLRNEL
ncbi:MAG TPA: ribokinase [Lachnospiraceae bacterium]|nr:ribokinase [Lachnospiraceae bacterium]